MKSLDCLPHALGGSSSIAHCTSSPEVHSASLKGRNGASRISHSRVSGLLGSTLPWLLWAMDRHFWYWNLLQMQLSPFRPACHTNHCFARDLFPPLPRPHLHHHPQCSHPQSCLYRELHSFSSTFSSPSLSPCLRSETAAPQRVRRSRQESLSFEADFFCSPGWPGTQRDAPVFVSADVKGVHHHAQQAHFLRRSHFLFLSFCFGDRISLGSSGCPGTCSEN